MEGKGECEDGEAEGNREWRNRGMEGNIEKDG